MDDGVGTHDLVTAYFEYFRSGFSESLFWAWDAVHFGLRDKPNDNLALVLALIEGAADDYCVELVGAGELEDLLWRSGDAIIDRIEAEVPRNPRLRRALWFVDGLSRYPAIRARVRTILKDGPRPEAAVRPPDWVTLPATSSVEPEA